MNQRYKFFQYPPTPSPAKQTYNAKDLLDRAIVKLTAKKQKIGGCPSSSSDF